MTDAKPAPRGAKPTSPGPLAGIRVLDMTAVVLGPLATQMLGDYGAEVIKVESPAGDLMRSGSIALHPGMASVFLNLNRNKRSLCIDLRQPEGGGGVAPRRAELRRAGP